MTDENQTEVVEAPEAADEAAEQQAFEAAFSQSRGDGIEHEPEHLAEQVEEAVEEAIVAGYTESQIKEMFGRLTKMDELENMSRQTRDQLFGKIGELNRTIQNLQSQRGGLQGLSSKQLKRLSEYDPELAESLADDLKSLALAPSEQGPSKEEIGRFVQGYVGQVVNQTVGEVSKRYEMKLLEVQHPDAGKIYQSPDFKAWLAAQDDETRSQLESSFDAAYVSSKLYEFKDWRDSSKPKGNDRLRRAAMPSKTGGRTSGSASEEDAFLAGFKAVRGSGLR